MSDTVISVENLSKRYLVGHQSAQRQAYATLRDVITREVRTFARKAVDLNSRAADRPGRRSGGILGAQEREL